MSRSVLGWQPAQQSFIIPWTRQNPRTVPLASRRLLRPRFHHMQPFRADHTTQPTP